MSAPSHADADLGRRALRHLEQVVRIDSASDEHSDSVPTTQGQVRLADHLATFFAGYGASVERDGFANIIASWPGKGLGVGRPPVALMVHLDTAPGTRAVEALHVLPGWQGGKVPYPENPGLCVDLATYPATAPFLGQDLVHGPGDAPFGLDDKLGLTHMMTLATLLPEVPDHPPLLLIGRPDEEVGREEALFGLAATLAERGVDCGFTVDGLAPFEINVENFEAAQATLTFPSAPRAPDGGLEVAVFFGGVNTHGATAKAEGHRPATRFAAEVLAMVTDASESIVPAALACVVGRDCDAHSTWWVADAAAARRLGAAVEAVVGPHLPRGASFTVGTASPARTPIDATLGEVLRFVSRFAADDGVSPIRAEDSEGRQGYSQAYRIHPDGEHLQLDIRIRDFDLEGLAARKARVAHLAPWEARVRLSNQYRNMGPRLAHRPEMVAWAREAAEAVGVESPEQPIRGGTGVDPFLDAGVPVANLGTGYFAPESEKEFTSLQLMAQHARWLAALLGIMARG